MNIVGGLNAGKHFCLLIKAERGILDFPSILALLKKTVIEVPALFKNSLEKGGLFFGRENPVFKCFKHFNHYN